MPALQGLGAPHNDPTRRAGLGGLSGAVERGHIARAAMEGLALRVREVFEHVYGHWGAPEPEFLGVDGGLTGNDTFMQIQADLLGRPIRRHAAREATACGAAIGAGRGVGLLGNSDLGGFVRHDRVFEPAVGHDEAAQRFGIWKEQVYD
jgi:glycerol kinase